MLLGRRCVSTGNWGKLAIRTEAGVNKRDKSDTQVGDGGEVKGSRVGRGRWWGEQVHH